MFDIGWQELLVIAIVMIVVVGPKDLPKMLRTFGRTTAKLRTMAGDFRKQFDDALKEAELDDIKDIVDTARSLNPAAELRKQLNPLASAGQDIRSGLEKAVSASAPAKGGEPATASVHTETPAKAGATAMPEMPPLHGLEPAKAMAAAGAVADSVKPAKSRAASKPAEVKPAKPRKTPAKKTDKKQ